MHQLESYDLGLRTYIDNTSSATYTYICKSLNPTAATTDKVWVCYRLTNADGTKSFANGIDNFTRSENLVKASLVTTYTYV